MAFQCECGIQTTAPFIIKGNLYCTLCAEKIKPEIVDSREKRSYRTYTSEHRYDRLIVARRSVEI